MLRVTKNKKKRVGFTLLEMVLVLAILCMTMGYIYGTFVTVQMSHLRVATVNDMHDFASLNLMAISNNLCNATTIGSDGTETISSNGTRVTLNTNDIISSYQQYHTGAGTEKWGVQLKFTTIPGSKSVKVSLNLVDMDNPSSGVAYHDEITVYCPSCKDMAAMTDSASITYSKDHT
ncbi:MAG: type II secretion system protein [Clostridiales bacterium]|nr:type II secretion system protein [Clostridiales bacterium]